MTSLPKGAPPLRGVFFDLDGTLYETPMWFKARIALRLARQISLLRQLGRSRDAIRTKRYPDGETLREAMFQELATRSQKDIALCREFYEVSFLDAFVKLLRARCHARPGLEQRLRALRSSGVKLAVVSDYPRIKERLSAIGLTPDLFDLLVTAEDAGALKPSPLSFQQAARQLQLDPEQVLVVGDRRDMDQAAASAASMRFLGVADRGDTELLPWPELSTELEKVAKLAQQGP